MHWQTWFICVAPSAFHRSFTVAHLHHATSLPLAGYPILSVAAAALVPQLEQRLEQRLATPQKTILLFANTNLVLKCQAMRQWLCGEEVILVNDGIGLDIAALLMHGRRYEENLNGTDFLPHLLKSLRIRRKIYLLGGMPGVAENAAAVIQNHMGHEVVGCTDGYSKLDAAVLRQRINHSGAEIVLVAMGNPIQEEWIRANAAELDASLLIGVGALFDFLSGKARRAPRWVQKIRFEWLFRLSLEPKRLLRRYTLDIASFVLLCLRDRKLTARPTTLASP
jgi:beta-1,4-glucosyltransferase